MNRGTITNKELKSKHPLIYALAVKRNKEFGWFPEMKGKDDLMIAFAWDETPEGKSFWTSIYIGNYWVYYWRYNRGIWIANARKWCLSKIKKLWNIL